MRKFTADLGLMFVAVLWGIGFIATKIGLNDGVNPLYMLSLRFIISSILLSIIFFKSIKDINIKFIKKISLISLILFFAYAFQIIGSKYTTASKAAFYTGLNVIFVPYISWMLNRKAPDIFTYIATLVCLFGVSMISYVPGEKLFTLNIGDALIIVSAIFFGAHIALTGYYSKKYSIDKLLIVQNVYCAVLFTVILIVASLVSEKEIIRQLSRSEMFSIAYLGLVTTGICLFLQAYFQRYTTSVRAAIFLSCESMFAPIFAYFILHEDLTRNIYIGVTCILIAVVLTEANSSLKIFKKKKEI